MADEVDVARGAGRDSLATTDAIISAFADKSAGFIYLIPFPRIMAKRLITYLRSV